MSHLAEIHETVMLVCFGFSWPINLIKHIKLRSAKSTSLPFLLLIWGGYIAGVVAKLIKLLDPAQTSPTWYLMTIYLINLAMLTANLLVYFRNRRLDRLAEAAGK